MFRSMWMRTLPAAALILGGLAAEAKVELAPVFSDNAVLQRDVEVPVWGFADPGESVTVKFADQTKTTTAGEDGKWMVKLSPLAASKENRTLEASGPTNSVNAKNILVGEVWIASGQSNMEMPLWGGGEHYRHRNANGTGKEVADRTNLPLLRFTNMPRQWSTTPSEKEPVKWNQAVPGVELERASATAFFFGRELLKELDVPIGILGAYWGGTRIEPWTPPEGFNSVPEVANIARSVNAKIPGTKTHKEVSDKVIADYSNWLAAYKDAIAKGEQPPQPPAFPAEQKPFGRHQDPTVLYNKMLYGFVPYAVRGAIWYQGESNLGDKMLYKSKMQALLNGWKQVFRNPGLKLYFVQLAPYTYNNGDPTMLPQLREAQQAFADGEKDAGMAIISDAVHNVRDIHPADKEIVGKRLAYLALNRDYGRSDIKADSPRLRSSRVEGNQFILDFDFVESWKAPGNTIPFFEVAGADCEFFPAQAEIDGTRLMVSSDKVSEPKSLRYMWNETNEGKLANEARTGARLVPDSVQSDLRRTARRLQGEQQARLRIRPQKRLRLRRQNQSQLRRRQQRRDQGKNHPDHLSGGNREEGRRKAVRLRLDGPVHHERQADRRTGQILRRRIPDPGSEPERAEQRQRRPDRPDQRGQHRILAEQLRRPEQGPRPGRGQRQI